MIHKYYTALSPLRIYKASNDMLSDSDLLAVIFGNCERSCKPGYQGHQCELGKK